MIVIYHVRDAFEPQEIVIAALIVARVRRNFIRQTSCDALSYVCLSGVATRVVAGDRGASLGLIHLLLGTREI